MSSVISRPTTRSKQEVSLSFFSFLFSEMVTQAHKYSTDEHLEHRLHRLGVTVGERAIGIFHLRDRPFRRETSAISLLQFIAGSVWKSLFQRPAEVMATDQQSEFYLVDKHMLLNKFISVSMESAQEGTMVNCANFAAGIIEGMVKTGGFKHTKVEAVFTHSGTIEVVDEPGDVTFIVRTDGISDRNSRKSFNSR